MQGAEDSNRHRTLSSDLFDSVNDVEPSGRTDEGVVEVLLSFFDEFLGLPLLHAGRKKKGLEGWEHDIVIHPRQLADGKSDGIFGPETYGNIAFLGDYLVESARVRKECRKLRWYLGVDSLVMETLCVRFPQSEPASHA